MQLYNIELFTKDLSYISSFQLSTLNTDFDYLSPDEDSISIPLDIICNVGNLIVIRSLIDRKIIYIGIITTINETKLKKTVKYKPMLTLFDVSVVVGNQGTFVERWIEDKINETYISNPDELQNMPVLKVKVDTETFGTIDTEEYIVNLLDEIGYVLKKYNILVTFDIDFDKKKIIVQIRQNKAAMRVIEADLPNILSKTIEVKSSVTADTLNKLTIMNTGEEGHGEIITYYKLVSGEITVDPDAEGRITPVIFDIKTIEAKPEEFLEKALENATKELAEDDYNNLIELTVEEDDELIHPSMYEVGQKVFVLSNNKQYVSYYTGYKLSSGKLTMIFGSIRLELTKKLKRRLKK